MTMATDDTTGPTDLAQCQPRIAILKMVHRALVSGAVMFGILVYLMTKETLTYELALRDPFAIGACVTGLIGMTLAAPLRGILCTPVSRPPDFKAAWLKYQSFVFARCALLEGGVMFSAVAVLVTHNILPGISFVFCAAALAFYRPTQQEFVELFKLE